MTETGQHERMVRNLSRHGPFRLMPLRDRHEYHLDDRHWICRGCDREIDHAGDNEPSGFILTTILGIVGAFVATYVGQAIGQTREPASLERLWAR